MKKFIKLFLIFSLLNTQFIMAGDSVLSDALNEVTNIGIVTDGTGGSTIYSGSASIRFNFARPPQPLWSFTPPSIEAGCNGIDIKGMFMSLLGLDQLGDMLENAGTSLAWGIAVGIIYSLPGVANAFKFINAWAKKIQQLLAAACGAGIIIGEWMADQSGLNKTELSETINEWTAKLNPGAVLDLKQKGAKGLLEVLGLSDTLGLDEAPNEEKSDAIVSLFKGVFESDASSLGAVINELALRSESGGTGLVFESVLGIPSVRTGDDAAIKKIDFLIAQQTNGSDSSSGSSERKVVGIKDFGKIASSLTGTSQAELAVFAYVLQFNFIGDLAITLPKGDSLNSLFNIAKSTDDSNTSAKNNARNQYKELQKSNPSKLTLIGGHGPSEKAGSKRLAEFIWYGIDSTAYSDQPTAISKTNTNINLIAPVGTIYVIRTENAETSNSAYIPVLGASENKDSPAFYNGQDKYKGSLLSSQCIVEALMADGNTTNCTGYTFPEVHKYIKVIKNSPTSKQFFLKNKLIQIMSVKMAEALLGAIDASTSMIHSATSSYIPVKDSVSNITGDLTPSISSKETIKAILSLKKKKSAILRGAKKYLEDEMADDYAQLPVIETLFFEQARENRQRGLKSLQK